MEKSISPPYIIVLILAFGATIALNRTEIVNPYHSRYLVPPPEMIEYFTFGFSESVADSIWLRWIQDSDVCQTYEGAAPKSPIGSNTGAFPMVRNKYCDNSWGFKMLDATTRLAPKFKMPYLAGGMMLAVATEDYTGATVIFDRGVKNYPEDWNMLYRAAYHYLFDLNKLPEAADLLERSAKNGAPIWIHLLAARVYKKAGQLELGLQTLLQYRELIKDNPEALELADKRIDAFRKQLDEESAKEP